MRKFKEQNCKKKRSFSCFYHNVQQTFSASSYTFSIYSTYIKMYLKPIIFIQKRPIIRYSPN